ncbi:MAG: hypothetical protein ACLT98_05340 [Eggerthellaceae bacterium]
MIGAREKDAHRGCPARRGRPVEHGVRHRHRHRGTGRVVVATGAWEPRSGTSPACRATRSWTHQAQAGLVRQILTIVGVAAALAVLAVGRHGRRSPLLLLAAGLGDPRPARLCHHRRGAGRSAWPRRRSCAACRPSRCWAAALVICTDKTALTRTHELVALLVLTSTATKLEPPRLAPRCSATAFAAVLQ